MNEKVVVEPTLGQIKPLGVNLHDIHHHAL
jgi:hypothetical protein